MGCPSPLSEVENEKEEVTTSTTDIVEEQPKPGTAAYYATLPPDQRPSPFKEGNIIWVNHVYDASEKYRDSMKMCERIEHYPGMFSHQDYRPKMPYAVYPG